MTAPHDPNSLSERLLDALLDPREADPSLDARVAADPAAAGERARLAAFLKAAGAAHDVRLDPLAAERVAARVEWRVHAEEGRGEPAAASRRWWAPGPLWARVLAASVAIHAVVIVALAIQLRSPQPAKPETPGEPWVPVIAETDESAPADVVREEPLPAPLAPYAGGLADVPIGPVLASLPDEGESWRSLEPADPAALRRWFPSVASAMWLRSDAAAPTRAEILKRLGVPALATRPKPTLEALAQRQAPDGSFEPAEGHGRVQSTATVLLAFESEGNGSRSGAHRAVVESGVRFLRHALALDGSSSAERPAADGGAGRGVSDPSGEPWALMALTEDVMLSSGSWTPAETRSRTAEVARLAKVVGARKDAAGGLGALATAAASRLRAAPGAAPARGWGDAYLHATSLSATGASPEVLRGTAMLLSGRTADFASWASTVLPRVEARFALDGLVRASVAGSRVEETALALLALQVPYRTY